MQIVLRVFIIFVLFFNQQAFSYIPHSNYIIEKISQERPKDTKVLIQSQLRFFVEGSDKILESYTEELEVDTSGNILVLRVFDSNQNMLFTRDLLLARTEADLSPTTHLIFSKNGLDIIHSLIKKGVPVVTEKELERHSKEIDRRALEKLSVQRLENQYAWVIGTKEKERGSSLWILKDTFRPLKFVLGSSKGSSDQPIEVFYKDYQPLAGMSYPTKISLVKNDFPFITLEVLGTKKITKISPTRKIKWEYPSQKREYFQSYIELLR